nr:diadenylate cyclase CdaA [Trichothermofontia sichuanensis]
MGDSWMQWLTNLSWASPIRTLIVALRPLIDVAAVFVIIYLALVIIGERRTLWIVRGFIVLVLAAVLSDWLGLQLLSFVLEKLVIGSAVAMAVILQAEFRRLLELLGRGQIWQLFQPSQNPTQSEDTVIDEIVDAVKELSQNRTGALIILETGNPIDDRDFSVPGVKLNAEVSKELLQSIFQTTTLLHDGAVLIRGSRVAAAAVILPISEQPTSRRLGTRHRAALGITERVENCVCIVVSEETGSISLAEKGTMNRPLTSSKLKELLEERFSQSIEREPVAPNLRDLVRHLSFKGFNVFARLLRLSPSTLRERK